MEIKFLLVLILLIGLSIGFVMGFVTGFDKCTDVGFKFLKDNGVELIKDKEALKALIHQYRYRL